MDISPVKDLFISAEDSLDVSLTEARKRTYIFVSILGLAVMLRLYGIAMYPLQGDEYLSLIEAEKIGLNWNSIIYSTLMHFWISPGMNEFWLRLPAVVFGVATVPVLFKVGEKLGGWRAGAVAGLLAATSPFSIYHSQEVRFYSFFIFTSALFLLATIKFVESRKETRHKVALLLTGIALFFSHFLGILALYAQGVSAIWVAKSGSRRLLLVFLVGLPVLLCAFALTPAFHHTAWQVYQAYGNAPSSAEPAMTSVSPVSLAKMGFAGFVFTFGYHVYPLRLALVIAGLGLTAVLVIVGARQLWKTTRWGALVVAYSLALVAVYVVLDTAGGRLASGVSPRHVAFVWPIFVTVLAIGLSSFSKRLFLVLLVATLTLNAASVWAAWQKDWTYGMSTDYRAAAQYAARWSGNDTALIHDGRSANAIDFYFPKNLQLINVWDIQNEASIKQLQHQRLIFVTDDWEKGRRREFEKVFSDLLQTYSIVDGRVDYPLFAYVLERKAAEHAGRYEIAGSNNQLRQPLSFYGLEFQDLCLPASAKVGDVPLTVAGASTLPDAEGERELNIPVSNSSHTRRVILLTNTVAASGLKDGDRLAELTVENDSGKKTNFALRLGQETAAWDRVCEPTAACKTALQWRKRMAIVSQSGYSGALKEFNAGLHGVALELPEPQKVVRMAINYTATSGQLYLWGVALPVN